MKRVVVTSSISAITPSPRWPSDVVKREDCWTDLEYCKQKGVSTLFISILFRIFLVEVFKLNCLN